jgi:hypothetical protein
MYHMTEEEFARLEKMLKRVWYEYFKWEFSK